MHLLRCIQWASYLIVLCIWIYTASHFSILPSIIPTHFGANGLADGYGEKNDLWILPIIATIVLFVFDGMIKSRTKLNNPEKNISLQHNSIFERILLSLRVLQINILLSFFYIIYVSISSAAEKNPSLGIWFLPTFLFAILIPTVFLCKHSITYKKNETN